MVFLYLLYRHGRFAVGCAGLDMEGSLIVGAQPLLSDPL